MIPRLDDLTITQRIVLTVIIVLAALLFVAAVGFFSGDWEAKSETAHCIDDKAREEIRQLTLQAIDSSYKDHVAKLFEVWVRDPAEQPKRAKVGLQSGITAYLRARTDALKWEPPTC
jgi:hypothetical protein